MAFPNAEEIISDILEQWKNEKIIIHIIEEADLRIEDNEGFSAFSIIQMNKTRTIKHKNTPLDQMIRLDIENMPRHASPDAVGSIACMSIFYYSHSRKFILP